MGYTTEELLNFWRCARYLSPLQNVQSGYETHSASYAQRKKDPYLQG